MSAHFRFRLSGDLVNARYAKGYTQMYVAEVANLSPREYQRIEKGTISPGAEPFLRLVYLLDLDVESYREVVMRDVPVPPR